MGRRVRLLQDINPIILMVNQTTERCLRFFCSAYSIRVSHLNKSSVNRYNNSMKGEILDIRYREILVD